MKSAGKQQNEINEETYKTNVPSKTKQKPKTVMIRAIPNQENATKLKINHARTELIEYANEHNMYKKPQNKGN